MSLNSPPQFFRALPEYRDKAKIIKSAIAIPGSTEYTLVRVNGQPGKLFYVHVNLEHNTGLQLVIEVDKQDIVRHTPSEIEGTGAGKLALEIPNAVADVLGTTKSASLNYAISFRAPAKGLDFDNALIVRVENIGTAEYDIQAGYVLFAIARRRQKKKQEES